MNMKKTLIAFIACLSLASCSFLDVNPKGEVFDNDMFTTEEGYEDALYGIYAELGTTQYLYSDYLYWVPEVLCANESISDNGLQYMATAQWNAFGAVGIRNGIWKSGYAVINHLNNIIDHIEKGGENEFRNTPIFKGEALGLRAMVHFDLLRFFGAPVWADASLKAKAIPYVDKYTFSITPFSSVDQVYDKVIKDLKEAERCLEGDAANMPEVRDNATNGGFLSCRIVHMNLYAVQALLARVYWSQGDLDLAAEYAEKVIESGKFSFRPKSAFVQYDNGTLDLNETIFGIYSRVSNSTNASKYGLSGSNTSFTPASDWKALYEDGSSSTGSDWREGAWFDGTKLRYLVNNSFIEGSNSYAGKSFLGINILRISEMYYIMAEQRMSSDPDEATEWYDQVVVTRGLDALADNGVTVNADILFRERRKEFYGEGLHWHDMKRLGKDIQADATTILSGKDPNTYTLPIPTSEEANRNE